MKGKNWKLTKIDGGYNLTVTHYGVKCVIVSKENEFTVDCPIQQAKDAILKHKQDMMTVQTIWNSDTAYQCETTLFGEHKMRLIACLIETHRLSNGMSWI